MSGKVVPAGAGAWIAFAGMRGGHAKIAETLAEMGFSWVAPRAGGGSVRDTAWDPKPSAAACAAYHAAGIKVYPWLFSYPRSYLDEVRLFGEFMDEGADGVIIDAEAAWDHGQRDTANRYMDALRKALPDAFVADAPWPIIGYHPDFPAEEFGRGVDARMPQAYWTEIGWSWSRVDTTMRDHWAVVHSRMATVDQKPVWPIGITYGARELAALGAKGCPSEVDAADVAAFLDAYDGHPVSLYSLEAASPEVLAMLRDRAATKHDTDPSPAPQVDPGTGADDWRPSTDPTAILDAVADKAK